MTEVGHVITGATIGILSMPKEIPPKQKTVYIITFMLIATIPDWPFKNWGHDRYYFSHSLFVTLLFILLLFIALSFSKKLRGKIGDWPVMIGGSLAWLSHLLLDSFYSHGKGIAIYWPFSSSRLALPIPWFDVGTGSLTHLMQVFLIEFISYTPLLLVALLIRWMSKNEKLQV
jgi:membrane-bound metal-dependent hydrolase YbcI (DUF457 family)